MKKFQLITILIIALLFPISGNASDKDVNVINTPLDVNVSNTPMVEVVNTEPMPTVVSNTSDNPIPVTMNESNGLEIVSGFGGVYNGELRTVLTVPDGKTFILTDIISGKGTVIRIYEITSSGNKSTKTWANTTNRSIHFRTGIPFSSGSAVGVGTGEMNGDITITGYLLEN